MKYLSVRGTEDKSLEYEVIAIPIKTVPPFCIHQETLEKLSLISKGASPS